jgi:hypothetical protein
LTEEAREAGRSGIGGAVEEAGVVEVGIAAVAVDVEEGMAAGRHVRHDSRWLDFQTSSWPIFLLT